MSEDPDHDKLNAVYFSDVIMLVNAVRSKEPPSPAEKEAMGRVAQKLLMDLGGIADSLKRIADAQETLARVGTYTAGGVEE